MKKHTASLGYTTSLPLVAALTTACIPERNYTPSLDTESPSSGYVCPITVSSPKKLPEEEKSFSLLFDKHSWSLKGYTTIMDYARNLTPGMSVIVRAYAHTPHGLTEQYAQKRIESTILFLERGNEHIDFVSEIVYDAKASVMGKVDVIPQKSRVHEALDTLIGAYDKILIEQSMAMQKDGFWNALQSYDFSGKSVSLVTSLPPECGKDLSRLSAVGRSTLVDGVEEYLAQHNERFLVIGSALSKDLTQLLKENSSVAVLSPDNLESDGVASAEDTGARSYKGMY